MKTTVKLAVFALFLMLFAGAASAASMLEITDVTIKVNDDKQSADEAGGTINIVPDSTLSLKIKITNLYDSSVDGGKIEDIEVTGTLEEIDDGDDLEETYDEFDLSPGRDKSLTLSYDIPLRLGTDETFKFVLEVEGEDENSTSHTASVEYDVDVDKEKHEIRLIRNEVTPTKVTCDRDAQLILRYINTGEEDEDVELVIDAPMLKFSKHEEFTLAEDIDDDDNEQEFMFNMDLAGVAPGIYSIPTRAMYYDSRKSVEQALTIEVGSCGTSTPTTQPVVTTPTQPEQPTQPAQTTTTTQPTQATQPTTTTVDVVSQPSGSYVRPSTVVATPKTSYNQSWLEKNKWLLVVLVTNVILIIAAIAVIVALLNRRKAA
jgi:hypothetical protein